MSEQIEFTEESIERLFGHEAAEDEDPNRLTEYYFRTDIFDRIMADVPLRLLVGHKGTGKSALVKIAIEQDKQLGRIPISIQPSEIATLALDASDFLKTVRNWQEGISEILVRKVLAELEVYEPAPIYSHGPILAYLKHAVAKAVPAENDHANNLRKEFLKRPQVRIYLDDLDRGWQGKNADITRISALLNAVRDLGNENRDLRFRLALRSDVYFLVRTSDESTDKIEGSVLWLTWTHQDIFVLLIKRIQTFRGQKVNEDRLKKLPQRQLAKYLDGIVQEKFAGRGHWENAPMYQVLMSLIRKRPRDLVKLCTLGAQRARMNRRNIITTPDFEAIFQEYSQGRMQDTINEFRSELPDIQRLLMNMKPNRKERQAKSGYVYRTDTLIKKLASIKESGDFIFASGKKATEKDLAGFLYKINFLTARKETEQGICREYFEEARYLADQFADFGYSWEIHPAYRWVLQPDDPAGIFGVLQLSSTEGT